MSLLERELSEAKFPRTHQVLREALADGVAPGFVAGVWLKSDPRTAWIGAMGQRRLHPSAQPLEPGTVFDLASVSKVMGTAALAAVLVDRGWIRWETSLRSLLPDYPHPEIELRHLLSHTAGLPAWQPLWERLRGKFGPEIWRHPIAERQLEMRRLVSAVAPDAPLSGKAVYSDISFLLLGFALEEVTQMPLDRAVREFVWRPMGIEKSYYARVDRDVNRGRDEGVAATEHCPWRGGVVQGQVHDDNCWAMGGYGGHAGVFGPASDVLLFAARMMGGFLSAGTLRAAWTRVSEPTGCERTLGWDTPSGPESSAGKLFSPKSVGHLGFTGTSLWIDPPSRIAVTLLSNRVHPSRDNIKIRAFRPRFHDAIRSDIDSWDPNQAK